MARSALDPDPVPGDVQGLVPTTPIYDALCREYRRLFRAVPGDRSGEASSPPEALPLRTLPSDRGEPAVLPHQPRRPSDMNQTWEPPGKLSGRYPRDFPNSQGWTAVGCGRI